jgi:hypothetical protein
MRARRGIASIAPLLALLAAGPLHADDAPQAAPPAAKDAPSPLPTPSPAPTSAKKEPAPPPSVTIIGARDALGVLGREVRSPTDQDMGHIVDVIVDLTGGVRAAVIDFGGFLGVGSRKIVVDWNALHFGHVATKGDSITLDLTKEQVTAAPEYQEDKPVVILGAAGKLSPWQFDH